MGKVCLPQTLSWRVWLWASPQTIQILGLCSVMSLAEPLPTWTASDLRRNRRRKLGNNNYDGGEKTHRRQERCETILLKSGQDQESMVWHLSPLLQICPQFPLLWHVSIYCVGSGSSYCVSLILGECEERRSVLPLGSLVKWAFKMS